MFFRESEAERSRGVILHPDLAKWLMEEGIESLSLNPDTVVETWLYLAKEAKRAKKPA